MSPATETGEGVVTNTPVDPMRTLVVGRRTRRPQLIARLVGKPLAPAGELFLFATDALRALFRRPFQSREFLDQAWFVTRVSLVPACLLTFPLGATFVLQIGSLLKQLGAESYVGAAAVLAVLQQMAPVATVIVVSGAGGAAVCADLGSRKIREELDAMEVLGISPIQRLVVPRVLALTFIAVMLNAIVSLVGILGGYVYAVLLQGGSGGAFLQSATALSQLPDLYVGELKAAVFGLIAGIVACHQGVNAKGGPSGVGDAVNQSVIVSVVLLYLANAIITGVFYQLVPPKGI